MFADDTHLTYADNDIAKIELINLTNDLESIREWLIVNKLTLNMTKTEFMVIGSRQRLYTFDNAPVLIIEGTPIKQVKSTKSRGLHIDEYLSWSVHVDAISKKIAWHWCAKTYQASCSSYNTAYYFSFTNTTTF